MALDYMVDANIISILEVSRGGYQVDILTFLGLGAPPKKCQSIDILGHFWQSSKKRLRMALFWLLEDPKGKIFSGKLFLR